MISLLAHNIVIKSTMFRIDWLYPLENTTTTITTTTTTNNNNNDITLLARISLSLSLSVSLSVCLSVSLSLSLSLSLATRFYQQLLPKGLLDYILCLHRTVVDKFLLVGQYLLENVAYEFVLSSPLVSSMSYSYYFDGFKSGCTAASLWDIAFRKGLSNLGETTKPSESQQKKEKKKKRTCRKVDFAIPADIRVRKVKREINTCTLLETWKKIWTWKWRWNQLARSVESL